MVVLNGRVYRTRERSITLVLDQTRNQLEVSTELACQGTYAQVILLESRILVYPNPLGSQTLKVFSGGPAPEILQLSLCNALGILLWRDEVRTIGAGEFTFGLNSYPAGMYVLLVSNQGQTKSFKLLKE